MFIRAHCGGDSIAEMGKKYIALQILLCIFHSKGVKAYQQTSIVPSLFCLSENGYLMMIFILFTHSFYFSTELLALRPVLGKYSSSALSYYVLSNSLEVPIMCLC